jgi:ribosomal protein S18 acetylase RimI-like enzyme
MQMRPASADDLDAIFDLFAARDRTAFGTVEVLRRHIAEDLELTSTDHFVALDDRVVGYGKLDGSGQVVVVSADDAVGTALLEHLRQRAGERGLAPLTAIVSDEDVAFAKLLRRAGFRHHDDVLRMWRPLAGTLDEPAVPAGIVVRTYADADAAAVKSLLDDAYGWDETDIPLPLDDWVRWMTGGDEFDPALWFLAERDGELVACALHWDVVDGRGWLKDLAVREPERGRGLAATLLRHGFAASKARGADAVGLKVHATNPTGAVRLYEREGFTVDRRYGNWATPKS